MASLPNNSPASFASVLSRARVLFSVLVMLVLLSTASSLVLGWKSGELDKRVITPAKQFFSWVSDALTALDTPKKESTPSGIWKKYVNVTPTQPKKRSTTQQPSQKIIINEPKYQTSESSYEETVRQMNERASQQKAAQDAWWSDQQKQFEATKQQNQQNFLNSQQQAQQNMDQFQKESQARVDEFKQKYGF